MIASPEIIQNGGSAFTFDVQQVETSPQLHNKLELNNNTDFLTPNNDGSPDSPQKSSAGSPNSSRRVLPSTPTTPNTLSHAMSERQLSKTQSDSTDSLMRKFRYDTIARKKKDSKNKQRNSSTFYTISTVQTDPQKLSDSEPSMSSSEPNIPSALRELPSPKHTDSPKHRKKDLSPLFGKKPASPSLSTKTKTKEDSPLAKFKENLMNNDQLLKKKVPKITLTNNNGSTNYVAEKQTHVALYKFVPRHKDELAFNDGDPIHVLKMCDDLWYEGINISSGKQGTFPCRYVADILADELESTIENDADHKQFHLRFLGSVEVQDHKGDEILMYAIARVVNQRSMLSSANPPTCVLQISSTGVRICNMMYGTKHPVQELDKKNKKGKQEPPQVNESTDETHYFSLKNVTFCGNHPKDKRYFGFITKHPDDHRFACHVLMSKYSTDPIAKIFGSCFEKFYVNFLEYRAGTEDIYLE